MKKFLLKIFIIFAIVIGLLFVINKIYISTDYYRNLNEMGKFYEVPGHIEVANFGASHSQNAFDWSVDDSINGMNMALGAQTVVYDEALFNSYFDHLDENSTVILELMFKSLYEEEPDEEPYEVNITRYYQILGKDYIRQWNFIDALNYQYFPILGNRQNGLQEIVEQLKNSDLENAEEPQTANIELMGEPTQVLDGWEEDTMIVEGKRRAGVFMELSGNQELKEQYEALIRIIEKCQEHNIQVILVTAPTLPCFYEGFSEEFMEKFYDDIDNICAKYDVLYLDYTGDERFLTDYRWYRDTDHLNQHGAKVFTEAFLKDNRDILKFYRN